MALLLVSDAFVPREACAPRLARGPRVRLSAATGAEVDDVIDKLMELPGYEVPGAVAKFLPAVSNKDFFLRIAQKVDEANDEEQKMRYANLADAVVKTLNVLVESTEDKMDVAAKTLQQVLSAAAEDDGEFLVPLSAEKRDALKAAVTDNFSTLDQTFLSTVNSWMKKSQEDKLDGMVGILQKVLQFWASQALLSAPRSASEAGGDDASFDVLRELLDLDAESWDSYLKEALNADAPRCSPEALLSTIQRRMEAIVLNEESGSMSQQIKAEFIQELAGQVEAMCKAP